MTVAKRKIGLSDVHPVGLGCMNLSHAYGPAQDRGDAVTFLQRALDLGYDFFDTATIYGMGNNEKLIGEAISKRRSEFTLASKCVMGFKDGKRFLDGRPETIKAACNASLERLQTDVIDLYYMHRPDPNVPIEDSVGALSEMVEAGKIRMIGLSEMSAETLRKAHAVHPIAAMQSEYSLMTRNPEIAVLEACRELGVTFVPFSPVGRGYLADEPLDPEAYHESDLRRTFPRFTDPHFSANLALLETAKQYSSELGCTVAQLALAWTLAMDKDCVPIPGTTNLQHLEDNFNAASIEMPDDMLAALNEAFSPDVISGPRYSEMAQATVTTERFGFEA
ncbi:MAG: aldo/keto reductase [Pseudomonadales bacterium]|nr:aldo/keto reductase [Pseudomonadales bacterium]MBO6564360.1 aldo/keto reductase [Pseudomonadales bacterium]MBO6595443.1 aldo/keto reductase [Pseudomonadales bacterium]MBO6657554.1 aldo/keto reductase [Pseudomonadales bacterium]MBO6701943.1 aldo/keto reductase [Pseudomonadales bacterium]